jgi:phospholipase A-2-activating protein
VCVFNKEGSLVAAQWISGAWVIVGTVTSTGDGGHINDVWYDHIMPVEIEGPTGVRNLRLGHNNGENPFTAAQRFIDQNELQQSYLGQIADWITARAGQTMPTIGSGASGVVGNPGTLHTEC